MSRIRIALFVTLLISLTISAALADVLVCNFNADVVGGTAQPPVLSLTGAPGTAIDIDLRLATKRAGGGYPSYPAPIRILDSASYTAGIQQIPLSWLSTPDIPGGILGVTGAGSGASNGTVGPSAACRIRLTIPASAAGSYAVLVSSKRSSGGNNPSPGAGFQIMLTTGDNVPPAISSVHLDDTIVSAGTDIPVQVNASDSTGVTSVTASGTALSLSSGSAQAGLWTGVVHTAGLAEGAHGVTVVAADGAGNSVTDTSASFTVDNTPPQVSITGVQDGAYYNSAVTPTVTIEDAHIASSSVMLNGQPFVSGSAISADGNYTLAAFAEDEAGNTASAQVSFVIDTVAPAINITGAADGDYRKSFDSVSYSVLDANLDPESIYAGLTRSIPIPGDWPFASGSAVTEEGRYTLLVQAADLAGNQSSLSIGFTADSTSPDVAFLSPVAGPHGYVFNSDQTIGYGIFDALDPEPFFVQQTLATRTAAGDSEEPLADGAIVSEDGAYSATVIGSDHADNTASVTLDLLIDTAPPQTAISPGGPTGNNGWFLGPVTIMLSSIDPEIRQASVGLAAVAGSGVLQTLCDIGAGYETYDPSAPPVLGADGVHSILAYSEDFAGNQEDAESAQVKIDATAPEISLNPVATPTNQASQIVSGTYVEANLLGIDLNGAACSISGSAFSAAVPLVEGNNNVIATAEDEAGHKASAQAVILRDSTPPTSGVTLTEGVMGLNGWYRSNVILTLSALDAPAPGADASAGVDSILWSLDGSEEHTAGNPVDVRIDGDAIHSLEYYATDLAGNVETDKSLEVKIDSTPPRVTASCSPEANAAGWNNTDVTVSFAATDNLSGVAQIDTPILVTDEGAAIQTTGSATDFAGNTGFALMSLNIDKTGPSIEGSVVSVPAYTGSGHDWFASDVEVSYTASDALSGLSAPRTADPGVQITFSHSVTGEGVGLTDSASATDMAGNDASATVSGIDIDRHGPTITILGVTNGASYPLGNTPTPSYTAVDALSGLADSLANLTTPATPSGVGGYTYSVSATDNVGNNSSAAAAYAVIYPSFIGFLQPINLDGSSIFKFGSTVPVKFQVKDATGGYVKNCVAHILCAKVSDGVAGSYLEAASAGAADTGNTFRYDLTGNQYIFNLSTKWMSPGTWIIRAVLDDGSIHDVRVSLKK